MGEIDADIEESLKRANPKARAADLAIYADALRIYIEAADNIKRHGAIVSHPRTGAPVENPYLQIQNMKASVLTRMRHIKSDDLFRQLKA